MNNVSSNRILPTSSSYAKDHLLYVQEIGTLTSKSPHISTRNNIFSYLFLVVINGSGTFTYHGQKVAIRSGDCIFIDCHEPYSHESSADDPWTLTWVHFYGRELSTLYKQYLGAGYSYLFHPNSSNDFLTALSSLYHVQEQKSALTEMLSNKYLTDIITLSFTENNPEEKEAASISEKLLKIREYMMLHYGDKLSLELLSKRFYISKFHLSREYKHFFGVTLMNDLTAVRISQAKSLLRFTHDTVESIAEQCGFSDSGYFIKVFKAAENMTPHTYRTKW